MEEFQRSTSFAFSKAILNNKYTAPNLRGRLTVESNSTMIYRACADSIRKQLTLLLWAIDHQKT